MRIKFNVAYKKVGVTNFKKFFIEIALINDIWISPEKEDKRRGSSTFLQSLFFILNNPLFFLKKISNLKKIAKILYGYESI